VRLIRAAIHSRLRSDLKLFNAYCYLFPRRVFFVVCVIKTNFIPALQNEDIFSSLRMYQSASSGSCEFYSKELYEVAGLILTTLVRTPGVPDIRFFIYQGIQGDLGGVPGGPGIEFSASTSPINSKQRNFQRSKVASSVIIATPNGHQL
jgi:hypothetical protein